MATQYKVVDNAFNQKNYPDLVGQVLTVPPAYANVEVIKDLPPMGEIYRMQSNWIGESYGDTKLDDFVIKCLKAGYDKPEIIEGLGKYFRQSVEAAQGIFTRAVVKMKNLKPPKDTKEVKHRKASRNTWYKKAMKVEIGEKGLDNSWQAKFPADTKCCKCGGNARIGFVAQEEGDEKELVASLHSNEGGDGGKYWLHDACAVAIYFCENCLEPTAEYNQG